MKKNKSVTLTALVWLLMLLLGVGVIMALAGFAGTTAFEFQFGDASVKTSGAGLAIFSVAAILLGVVITNLPENVELYGQKNKATLPERLKEWGPLPWFLSGVIGIVAAILLI